MQPSWQPTAAIETLQQRAFILDQIRTFFKYKQVMEVETPILNHYPVTDPYLNSLTSQFSQQTLYLQTSPEYCMKRLLAAGSGSIYQITKAFRDDEVGRYHNPEFTLLEWYRVDFDHFRLMAEVDELLQLVLQTAPAEIITYQTLFQQHLSIDPLSANCQELLNCCQQCHIALPEGIQEDKDGLLQCLMSDYIEPRIGIQRPIIVYHYPASQAALARLNPADPRVSERFEVYFQNRELANGFHELSDAKQQSQRFIANNQRRSQLGLPTLQVDNFLLAALHHGLPDCAGVALGIDRLVMLATKATHLTEVISFGIENS